VVSTTPFFYTRIDANEETLMSANEETLMNANYRCGA